MHIKKILGTVVFALLFCNVGFAKFAVLECMIKLEAEAEINPKVIVEIDDVRNTIFFLQPDIGYLNYNIKPHSTNPNEFLRKREKSKLIGILYDISKIDNMNIYATAGKANLVLNKSTLKLTTVLKFNDGYQDTSTFRCKNLD